MWNIEYTFKEKESVRKFKWDKLLENKEFKNCYNKFLQETNPVFDETCNNRLWTFQYCNSILKEISRREQIYGKKKKNSEEDEVEAPVAVVDDDETNADGASPRAKYDPYKLSLPDFPMQLTKTQIAEEEQIMQKR